MGRPILSEQRRMMRLGTIRAGEKTDKGPSRIESWRLTSSSPDLLGAAAAIYGGQVREWADKSSDETHELYTETATLDVAIPLGGRVWDQAYEAWTAGGRSRMCDGSIVTVVDPETGEVTQRDCMCVGDGSKDECKPTTRVNFILPLVPGLGTWLLTTRSDYAAREMPGALDFLASLMADRRPVRARLRLEPRTTKKQGEKFPRRYAVPVLDLDVTVAELMAGAPPVAQIEPPPPVRALPAPAGEPDDGAVVAETVGERLSESQRRKLFASAADLGVTREMVRELARRTLDHGVSDMTQDERGALWAAVQNEAEQAESPDESLFPSDEKPSADPDKGAA